MPAVSVSIHHRLPNEKLLASVLAQKSLGLRSVMKAITADPDWLMVVLNAGWAQVARKRDIALCCQALVGLKQLASPEHARQALRLFFQEANADELNNMVLGCARESRANPVMLEWLDAPCQVVGQALVRQALYSGLDLERGLRHQRWSSRGLLALNGPHNVLSATIANSALCANTRRQGTLSDSNVWFVLSLASAGKLLDIKSVTAALSMPRKLGIAWLLFLGSDGCFGADKVLQATHAMALLPDVKATLASMDALQSINALVAHANSTRALA